MPVHSYFFFQVSIHCTRFISCTVYLLLPPLPEESRVYYYYNDLYITDAKWLQSP